MNSVDGLSPHTAESRENLSFLQFLNNDRNRSILQKIPDIFASSLKLQKTQSLYSSESNNNFQMTENLQ